MKHAFKRLYSYIVMLCVYLLSFGVAVAGVCDNFGVSSSDSYYIPAPITKFCVEAGSDPPEDWVPQVGLGKGLGNTQSGPVVLTNRASSLCPAPRMTKVGDENGCPNYQFPNCMGAPGDASNGGAKNSGACVTGAAPVEELDNLSDSTIDETYDEITADDIKCAVQLEVAAKYYPDRPQSACYGGDAKYCANKGQHGTCDTKDDTELEWPPYPHEYVEPEDGRGFVQLNDIEKISIGSAWQPKFDACANASACQAMFESIPESHQELMIDSMFFMTGNFKVPQATKLELNNGFKAKWRTCVNGSNCLLHNRYYTECGASTMTLPANAYFKITNLPNEDIKNKYLILWTQGVTGFQRNLSGDPVNPRSFGNIFVGRLPAGNDNFSYIPVIEEQPIVESLPISPTLEMLDTPLLMSGSLTHYKKYVDASLITDPDDIPTTISKTYDEFMANPYSAGFKTVTEYHCQRVPTLKDDVGNVIMIGDRQRCDTSGSNCVKFGYCESFGTKPVDIQVPIIVPIEDLGIWAYCETIKKDW